MKCLSRLLYPLFLSASVNAGAQTNAGMPLVKEMAEHFFYNYEEPNASSSFEFQKKKEGWWVLLLDPYNSGFQAPQLFWSRKERRYLPVKFESRNNPDSTSVAEAMANKSNLSKDQMINYDRSLYYGYDGWESDVIAALETTPPTSDSLWEALGKVYDAYSYGYLLPQNFGQAEHGDTDRAILPESISLSQSRVRKFVLFERKALSAFQKIYNSNSQYQCGFYDIGWQLNSIRMGAAVTLTMLDFESLSSSFVQKVAYPDSVLRHARRMLQQLPANSILFTDRDTTTFPIMYLQMKGERQDVVTIDNLIFLLKRSIGHLDLKFRGSLFTVKPTVYKDSAFQMAVFQEVERDTEEYRLDSFLARLYASPDQVGLPPIAPSLGRLYRYFSKHPYVILDRNKSNAFYPNRAITDRLTFDLPDQYMMVGDILNLDIINTNLLIRHIFFTHPSEHPIFQLYCVRVNPYVYEFIPTSSGTSQGKTAY